MVTTPDRPRRLVVAVKILKFLEFLEGIHTGPESVMSVGEQFSFRDQPSKGLFHQFLALLEIAEDFPPEDEETTVNPSPGLGNMLDTLNGPVSIDRNHVKTRPGLDTDKA